MARVIGRSTVASPRHTQRYFVDLKGFGAVDELVTIVTGGVPVNAAATGVISSSHYSMAITPVIPSICQQSGRKWGKA